MLLFGSDRENSVGEALTKLISVYNGNVYFGENNGTIIKISPQNYGRIDDSTQISWSTFQGNNQRTGNQSNLNLKIHDNDSFIPSKFTLHQNYPNPFNPVTTLRYDLPEQANVNIIIYDLLGREVRTLVNTTQDAGFKSVIWDATNDYGKPVSAGVYLYQIQAGEFVQTKKMVLLK